MAYDKHSGQGVPEVGEPGLCRQCPDEYGFPTGRLVTGIRQCWIETTVKVHLEKPETA
jgi:hypothetical protein